MSTRAVTSRSTELYARAQHVLPGGVSRNTVLRDPHPLYVDHGSGCHVVDIDGVSRIDFSNNMASLIHGHACPEIVEPVTAQLARGSAFMLATEVEVRYAEHLCERTPSFEKMRFVNSGTEAIMVALKASRAFTGRPRIAKVEGAYHGTYDFTEVSQAPNPENWGSIDHPSNVALVHGTPPSAVGDVVILPFNDADRAVAILDAHADELACVLIDLMPHRVGLQLAEPEFVHALRDWTTRHGALLVLDEVVTYRSEFGGLQARYGIRPDLSAIGKMIGGGFPIGACAGRSDVMDVMNPQREHLLFPHSGTFSANPISVTAGLAAMEKFDEPAVERLNALAERAVRGIKEAIDATGVPASVSGCGSIFRVHMKERVPRDYREAFLTSDERGRLKSLLDHLSESGLVMINTCTAVLSTPMTETEIDALVAAFTTGFERIADEG